MIILYLYLYAFIRVSFILYMKSFCAILQREVGSKDADIWFETYPRRPTVKVERTSVVGSPRQDIWTKCLASNQHYYQLSAFQKYQYIIAYMYVDQFLHVNRFSVMRSVDDKLHMIVKAKFVVLKNMLNTQFLCPEHASIMLDIFCKAQRAYHGFLRLARVWRIKSSVSKITHDLYLNPIEPTTPSIMIYQDDAKYLFRLTDLMNIIHTALSHCLNFFVDPLHPRNPYTNNPFSKAMLYEIYFKVRSSQYRIPRLYQLFYESDFHLVKYTYENEATIREVHLYDYVFTSPASYLKAAIFQMLKRSMKGPKWKIHESFPDDRLAEIMRPYLYLYYVNLYSLSHSDKKFGSFFRLQTKLRAFQAFNPHFGRIYYKMYKNKQGQFVRKTTFNDRCIDFYRYGIHQDIISSNHDDNNNDDDDESITDDDDDESITDDDTPDHDSSIDDASLIDEEHADDEVIIR